MRRKRLRGKGFLQDVDSWLKRTKVISNVGGLVLPALGGIAGTFLGGPGLATGVGGAVGKSINSGIASLGYGKRRRFRGKGLEHSTFGSHGSAFAKIK